MIFFSSKVTLELWLVSILQHHLLLTARGNFFFRSTYNTPASILLVSHTYSNRDTDIKLCWMYLQYDNIFQETDIVTLATRGLFEKTYIYTHYTTLFQNLIQMIIYVPCSSRCLTEFVHLSPSTYIAPVIAPLCIHHPLCVSKVELPGERAED